MWWWMQISGELTPNKNNISTLKAWHQDDLRVTSLPHGYFVSVLVPISFILIYSCLYSFSFQLWCLTTETLWNAFAWNYSDINELLNLFTSRQHSWVFHFTPTIAFCLSLSIIRVCVWERSCRQELPQSGLESGPVWLETLAYIHLNKYHFERVYVFKSV